MPCSPADAARPYSPPLVRSSIMGSRFSHRGAVFAALVLAAASAPTPLLAQGIPNVHQTPGTLLSGLNAPQQGRTAILAYHNGILFTVPEIPSSQPGADFQVRTWDISDPTSPVELQQWGITPMPINAHGYFSSGDYLVLGSNWPPEAPWVFEATGPPGTLTRTTFPGSHGAGVRGQLFQPWFVGDTYWSYGEISGNAFIEKDWVRLAEWDHLGTTGVIGHPFLLGDLLIFASDQSRTGVATYDVSDPTNPVLLDVLTTGGPGGYWPELWGGDGKLYIVFPYRTGGNGFRIVDATDPSNLQFVTDRSLPGDESMYVQFQDEFAFMGDHKVDMRSFESVLHRDAANAVRPSDGGTGVNTSQFLLPIGNLLVTGGIGPNEGMAIWAHQATPDLRGPEVGYHVPQAGRTNYPVGAPISLLIHETLDTTTMINGTTFIVRPLGGAPISGRMIFSFDDVLTFTPDDDLLPDTTYEVVLPAGGIQDAVGNGMVGYSFTFSTGSAVGGNGAPQVDSFTATPYPVDPQDDVSFSASASDPDDDPLEYRFDFGDGSPRTAWSPGTGALHSYDAPGHYRATVQARDPQGALATRAATVTVVAQPAGPLPTQSSQIACDDGGRRVYKVNPDNDTLAAVDADSLGVELEVPTCDGPRSVALSGAGELWVACERGDRIAVHSAGGALVEEIVLDYGSAPIGIAFSPGGQTAFVSYSGSGELARFDAATRTQTGLLPLGPTPRAIAVAGDGTRLWVTRFLSPKDHAEVWEVDPASLSLVRTVRIAKFGGDDHRDTTASGKGTPNQLVGAALSPDGASLWVTATKPNSERGLLFHDDLDQDNTVRNVALQIDTASGQLAGAIDLDNSDSASGIGFSPLGDYVFVTLQGNDEVVVLDALEQAQSSGLGSFVTRLGSGAAPQGVCVDESTRRTFVANFMGRSVTALETDALLRLGSTSVAASDVPVVAAETLPADVLLGKRLFYHASDPRMSAEGYLSCATCHLDGGHDGRVWDFTGRGEGLRNTTDLRGRGGIEHGNVHWSANFDEIQDFENDIRGAFGGSGFLSDPDFAATGPPLGAPKAGLSADLDALAAYVASLGDGHQPRSPHRAVGGGLTAQGTAGRGHFLALDCGSCHQGSRFTDSTAGPDGTETLHDVGTLRTTSGERLGAALLGIDTPTLRGVWAGAPYLHDGSAATLEDVFSVAGGVLLPAEDGSLASGAQVVDQWVHLNNDDTVRGRAYVDLGASGARVTFSGVDGGGGGQGAVELRYSAGYGPPQIEVRINGGPPISRSLALTGNDPQWRHTNWATARIEGLTFQPGAVNSIEIRRSGGGSNLSFDDLIVTSPAEMALAEPHRAALDLGASQRAELLAYLRQLDGSPEENPAAAIFLDGFESGDSSAWSNAVP
ncbi:MAG: PKD domain-containing protein [Acidobacteria bacterium]|nr:MAG: PKD domain-containing protein [Acidobacteriota bacterium]